MKNKLSIMLIIFLLGILLSSCKNDSIENRVNIENQVSAESIESAENQESVENRESTDETENDKVVNHLAIEDYLLKNSVAISIDNDIYDKNLNILDMDVKSNKIFLTAEVHGVKANSQLKIKFIKYFKEKTNFKYLLSETSYSISYFLNKFLETGDRSILDMLFQAQNGTYADSEDNYDGWISLYEFNNTLKEADRIRVIGVDIEHQGIVSYRYMASILANKEVPDDLKDSIQMINETLDILNSTFTKDYLASKTSMKLLDDIDAKRELYQEYLGDELIFFELVNRNVVGAKEAYKHRGSKTDWNNTRDEIIYNNFVVIDEVLEDGKYFGQWGLNHVFQREEGGVKWFASYLNSKESKYADKILSIVYNYENCESMGRDNQESTLIDFTYSFINNTSKRTDSNYILYKLNGTEKEKPFIPMYITWTGEEIDIEMGDFFQYIVLIKDSKASQTHK